jgi:hypothetical protein
VCFVVKIIRIHVPRATLRLALCAAVALIATAATAADSASALLTAAGNAGDDTVRLAHLRSLAASNAAASLDPSTRAELDALLPVVTAWAEGRTLAAADIAAGRGEAHRYLHGFFNNATRPFDPPFPAPPRVQSPVYPLWALYRARFLAWYLIEHSEVSRVPERRRLFLTEAERAFDVARRAFPENPVLRIYDGENLPATGLSVPDARAPAWANHQRRALEQLHRIIRWWIDERQLPNGEFGGNWGDDVEMWRWWAPILIGFDDPVVTAAQERLARGNLSRPALAAGYTSQLTDVEHSAEETADTLTPMLHAAPEDPEWTQRTRRLLALADAAWWGRNERGGWQFKHIDFNHERVGPNAARAYDTGYHVRAVQPVLLLWQRTADPALAAPLTRWLRTWADAALGTDNGKPAGIVPAALHWPSGRVGSVERGWVGPNLAGDAMEELYSWPGYPVSNLTAALLQAQVLTGENIFLEPLMKMAELRRAHLAAGNRDGPPGSAAWAAHRLPAVINDALAKWRQLTGDPRFDDLLRADASGYVRFILGGDEAALASALAGTAQTLSVNWPMFTTEVRYTDRVLSFPHAWPRTVATGLARVDAALLYSTVTGDPGRVETFPLNGVRWHTLPRDIAVRVVDNRRDRFRAEFFHFGAEPRPLAATLFTLAPGRYEWRVTAGEGTELARGELTLTAANRRLILSLPAGRPAHLTVEPHR